MHQAIRVCTVIPKIQEEHGYTSKTAISKRLIEIYTIEKKEVEGSIEALEEIRSENDVKDGLHRMLASIPSGENIDKVLKYVRSLQKSIYENFFLLKKLQKVF